MAKNKTTETVESVSGFLDQIADEKKRADSYKIMEIMAEESGFDARMWGGAIVGFGSYHYKYASGHEGEAPLVSFSPRADAISLYLYQDFEGRQELLERFGKHKSGKSCIYIKKLSDVDEQVFREMISDSVKFLQAKYPA
jgi:hypothetical protein